MTRRPGLLFLTTFTLAISLFSCKTTKNVYYAKEIIDSTQVINIPQIAIPVARIQPYDLLLINFYGKGLEMTQLFNNFGGVETAQKVQSSGSEALKPGYLVSPDGYIDLPQLGKIKVAGLTLSQLKADLTERATQAKMVEPNVVVKFTNFKITVIGEVAIRGTVTSQSEKLSIFEAIGLSGDVTLFGLKDRVKVIRTQDTTTTWGNVDLTSKDVFKSEYFYLKPNDVVYVPSSGQAQRQQKVSSILPFVSIGLAALSLFIALQSVLK
ncbi:MAG: polysaccharide biosynthesis/export family protein [Bacteroidota bacterium]